MPTPETIDDAALLVEAAVLTRFVVGREAGPEFAARYVAAHQHLLREPIEPRDATLLSLVIHRRWLLPCVDAALALRRPAALLHKKTLLMAAILEASPRFADDFLPRRAGALGLAWLSLRIGTATIAQLAIGLPIVWLCDLASRSIAGVRS